MGLHELVAATEDEYAALAAKICRDAAYRARIRERIEQSRGVLFEDEAPIRAMEEFLVEAVGQAR
jgi:predicted O-linked N-acetylglucosamine transferase (SPINDLY family)